MCTETDLQTKCCDKKLHTNPFLIMAHDDWMKQLHLMTLLTKLCGYNSKSKGEISPDLYRFVQCDIKKCAFDSLKLEQNP